MKWTKKQLAFVEEYFLCNMNGTQAAIKAGYSEKTAYSISSELLKKPEIKAEISRRLKERHMSAEEVLARLSEQASSAYGDYITETGKVDFAKLVKDGKAHLVYKIKPTKFGTEIEFYNGQNALLNIGKQHGMFNDHHIIEVKVEKELDSILGILEETLSPDEFQRIVARLTSGQTSSPEMGSEDSNEE